MKRRYLCSLQFMIKLINIKNNNMYHLYKYLEKGYQDKKAHIDM